MLTATHHDHTKGDPNQSQNDSLVMQPNSSQEYGTPMKSIVHDSEDFSSSAFLHRRGLSNNSDISVGEISLTDEETEPGMTSVDHHQPKNGLFSMLEKGNSSNISLIHPFQHQKWSSTNIRTNSAVNSQPPISTKESPSQLNLKPIAMSTSSSSVSASLSIASSFGNDSDDYGVHGDIYPRKPKNNREEESSVKALAEFLARTGPEDFLPSSHGEGQHGKEGSVYKRMWKEWKGLKKMQSKEDLSLFRGGKKKKNATPGVVPVVPPTDQTGRKFVMLPVRYESPLNRHSNTSGHKSHLRDGFGNEAMPAFQTVIPSTGLGASGKESEDHSDVVPLKRSGVRSVSSMRKLEDLMRRSAILDTLAPPLSSMRDRESIHDHPDPATSLASQVIGSSDYSEESQLGSDASLEEHERPSLSPIFENSEADSPKFKSPTIEPVSIDHSRLPLIEDSTKPNRSSDSSMRLNQSGYSSTGNAPSLIRSLIQTSAISPTRANFDVSSANTSILGPSTTESHTHLNHTEPNNEHLDIKRISNTVCSPSRPTLIGSQPDKSRDEGLEPLLADSSIIAVPTIHLHPTPRRKVRHVQIQTGSRSFAAKEIQVNISVPEASKAFEHGKEDGKLLSVLQSQNSSLQSNVSNLNTEVSTLQGENSLLQAQLAQLEKELAAARSQSGTADAHNHDLLTKYTSLIESYSSVSSRADALQAEASTHRAHVEYLEKQAAQSAAVAHHLEQTLLHERHQYALQNEEFERLSRAAYAKMKQLIMERIDLVNEIDVWRAKLREANSRTAERQVEEALGSVGFNGNAVTQGIPGANHGALPNTSIAHNLPMMMRGNSSSLSLVPHHMGMYPPEHSNSNLHAGSQSSNPSSSYNHGTMPTVGAIGNSGMQSKSAIAMTSSRSLESMPGSNNGNMAGRKRVQFQDPPPSEGSGSPGSMPSCNEVSVPIPSLQSEYNGQSSRNTNVRSF
jgi:predicted  nucleic acid-binding Zn-ribbon protein